MLPVINTNVNLDHPDINGLCETDHPIPQHLLEIEDHEIRQDQYLEAMRQNYKISWQTIMSGRVP